MCLPFLCGGRDDHGPSPRHHRPPPTPQHPPAFSDQDNPAAYQGDETRNGASHGAQANASDWRMDNGAAHPAPRYAPAGAPRHGHEPLASPRPVEDWTRPGPARLFTTRRAGDDDAPTAASNDQLNRGGNRGGAGEREYRSKSRGPVIR
ncbi:hypothetical protein VPH35_136714 [Triticum aestivum]|uniref:Uncharacterized protein n=1 Tax=Aegilops tauschii subsp. strangulata TaxID=200361 RepID=A0A453RFK5_AEGTS